MRYDVFLSYNSADRRRVLRIAEKLRREGLKPWLDRWCIAPGADWQAELVNGLRASDACAVCVGPAGIGDWAREELKVALDLAVKQRDFRVFPVLLPGLDTPFDPNELPPFLSTRTWVDLRPGIEATDTFQQLLFAINGVAPGAPPTGARAKVCPYRGLRPFGEEDAELFFGREADTQRLLEKLRATAFLAVLGPSGSGKSSLVRAGLLPALRRGELTGSDAWTIETLRPGAHPLAELAAHLHRLVPEQGMAELVDQLAADERALSLIGTLGLSRLPDAGRLVLVVDQFEEVFTLCHDDLERSQLFANLLYATSAREGRCLVVATMRTDFYSRLAAHPELAQQVAAQQYLVGPLDANGWRAVIEEPAWKMDLEFQPRLVETILEDVPREAGALPLLEHALLELWEQRSGSLLTLEGYQHSGGVTGAIAKRADELFDGLGSAQQVIAGRILLRLTQLGEGTEDTRRRATLSELVTNPSERDAVQAVVNAFADARLLTTDRDEQSGKQVIDVAHEALIRGWPRLRGWLDEDRAGLRTRQRLTEAAGEWARQGRDDGFLYHGAQLELAEAWRRSHPGVLNPTEREFLDRSAEQRAAVLAAEEERRSQEIRLAERARRARILRSLTTGLAFLTTISIVLGVVAVMQRNTALEQSRRIRSLQRSLQLAAQADATSGSQPDLSMLLSLAAFRTGYTLEARRSLLGQAGQRRDVIRLFGGHTSPVSGVVFNPRGRTMASVGNNGTIMLWDTRGYASLVGRLDGRGAASGAAFSPDGRRLAVAGEDTTVLWDVAGRTRNRSLPGHKGQVLGLAFSPNGRLLASGGLDGRVVVWDLLRDGARTMVADQPGAVFSVAFSPDGSTLAWGGADRKVSRWDVASRRLLPPLSGHQGPVLSVAFSPDGRRLASGGGDGSVLMWHASRPAHPRALTTGDTTVWVTSVAFSPDGKTLASARGDQTIILWNLNSGFPRRPPLTSHTGSVNSVAFSPDGSTLASGGGDGLVITWDARGTATLQGHREVVTTVAFSHDGRTLASGGMDGKIVVWDVAGRRPLRSGTAQAPVRVVAFSPDGRTLASASGNGVLLWDVSNLATPSALPGTVSGGSMLAFSPDGRRLAVASGSTVTLWDLVAAPPRPGRSRRHTKTVSSLAFSPDGKRVASADFDRNLAVWEVDDPAKGTAWKAPGAVLTLAFSPDGSTLASGGLDKNVTLWDVARRTATATLIGHTGQVQGLAFSPDGETLASGGFDRTISLWDVDSTTRLASWGGQIDQVGGVAFSPDGGTLASGGNRDAVTLWDVGLERIQRRLCAIVGRDLTDAERATFLLENEQRHLCP